MAGVKAFLATMVPSDPTNRFETSWLFRPHMLFCIRALFSLYAFTTLFFVMGFTCSHPSEGGCATVRRSFSYFTVLTYWGQAFYFLAAAGRTLTHARWPARLAGLPRWLDALHSLSYTSVTTLPLLVTLVFWGVLYRPPWFPDEFDAWRNVSEHALNAGFALFEVCFARVAILPWVHLPCLLGVLLGYLGVAYLTFATQGWYTYNFLDRDAIRGRGVVAGYVVGIAVAIVVVFLVVRGLVWLRWWVTEVRMGRGVAGADAGAHVDAHVDAGVDAEMGVVGNDKTASATLRPMMVS